MAPHVSGVVPVQLVVNIVAVVTAAVGAVALRESPLTAVQMVRPKWPALWPSTALAPRPGASRWYRPCILPKQDCCIRKSNLCARRSGSPEACRRE